MPLLAALLAAVPVRSEEDHLTLAETGLIREALAHLEEQIRERHDGDPSGLHPETRRDYARLLFEIGEVDRAIEEAEPLAESFRALTDRVDLLRYYRYRGRTEAFDRLLAQSLRISRLMMQYGLDADDWVAAGRLMDMDGRDPARILAHYNRLFDSRPDHVDGHVAAGDLALRTRGYDVAARHYHRALEVDETSQPALAGLIRSFSASADPRSAKTTERLRALNPRHPLLFELETERYLDLGVTDSAHAALDAILDVNPNHRDALALKAAAHFLADDHDAVADVQASSLRISQHASEAFRVPGRIASRHYRFTHGLAFQRRAIEVDPSDVEARLLLAFDLLRLGRDEEARPQLERVFETDPYNVQAYNLLGVSDAIAGFDTIEDDAFRLELPADEAVVFGHDALRLLNEAADTLERSYALLIDTPVRVQIFDDHDEFIVRSVGLPGSAGHLGICFGKLVTMDSPRARPPGSTNWRQVLWHEFVHVITLQKTNNRMPRWLSEGISVFEETRRDPAWGVRLDPQFKRVVDAKYPGLDDLERYFTQPESQAELMLGYLAAGEFVAAYVEAHGLAALTDALDRIGKGELTVDALLAAAGTTAENLDARFRERLEITCAPLAEVTCDPHAETCSIGRGVADLVARGDSLAAIGDVDGAEAAYRTAHERYPDWVGSNTPLQRVYALHADSDDDRAVDVLLEIVRAYPTDIAACLELADRTDDPDLHAFALDRAFAVNPFDLGLLRRRSDHAAATGDVDLAIADLDRLIRLDNAGRQAHRLTRARVLAAAGRPDLARSTLLTLLEQTPHDWPAQRLLLDLGGSP